MLRESTKRDPHLHHGDNLLRIIRRVLLQALGLFRTETTITKIKHKNLTFKWKMGVLCI